MWFKVDYRLIIGNVYEVYYVVYGKFCIGIYLFLIMVYVLEFFFFVLYCSVSVFELVEKDRGWVDR